MMVSEGKKDQLMVRPCMTADSGTSKIWLVPSIWYFPVAFTA
jgi:hypothetical protein